MLYYDEYGKEKGSGVGDPVRAADPVDDAVCWRDAAVCGGAELSQAQPGRLRRHHGIHAGQLYPAVQRQLSRGVPAHAGAGTGDHADLRAAGVSLRIFHGAHIAEVAHGADAAGDRTLLDERADPHLRLADSADG